jgi:hypothetical protein
MLSPVLPEYALSFRISPAPRKKLVAFEYVGAAAIALAANAVKSPRRVVQVEDTVLIVLRRPAFFIEPSKGSPLLYRPTRGYYIA